MRHLMAWAGLMSQHRLGSVGEVDFRRDVLLFSSKKGG